MNFIIIVLVLILFNVIIYMFTNSKISQKIINNFQEASESQKSDDCNYKYIALKGNHDECMIRCKIFILENKGKLSEGCDIKNCVDYCPIKEEEDEINIKLDPVVKYIPKGNSTVSIKWIPSSFEQQAIDQFEKSTYEDEKVYFSNSNINPTPLTRRIYLNFTINPNDKNKKKFYQANYIPEDEFNPSEINGDVNLTNEEHDLLINSFNLNNGHPNLIYITKNAFNTYNGSFTFKGYFPRLKFIGENAFAISNSSIDEIKFTNTFNIEKIHKFMLGTVEDDKMTENLINLKEKFNVLKNYEKRPDEDNFYTIKVTDIKSFDVTINENIKEIRDNINTNKEVCKSTIKNIELYSDTNMPPEWCTNADYLQQGDNSRDKWKWFLEYSPRNSNSILKLELTKRNTENKSNTQEYDIDNNNGLEKNVEYIFMLYALTPDNEIIKSKIKTLTVI